MRKMIFGLVSVAAMTLAAPAWSQDVRVGPGGVDVGVGPRHDSHWRDRRTYGAAPREQCHVTRERIETPSGRVIFKTRRECM
jgi:ribosomal protein L34